MPARPPLRGVRSILLASSSAAASEELLTPPPQQRTWLNLSRNTSHPPNGCIHEETASQPSCSPACRCTGRLRGLTSWPKLSGETDSAPRPPARRWRRRASRERRNGNA